MNFLLSFTLLIVIIFGLWKTFSPPNFFLALPLIKFYLDENRFIKLRYFNNIFRFFRLSKKGKGKNWFNN